MRQFLAIILNAKMLHSKSLLLNMACWMIFDPTFCCSNMLQEFESDSNASNIVAQILLELVCVTPQPSTFNAICRKLQRNSDLQMT